MLIVLAFGNFLLLLVVAVPMRLLLDAHMFCINLESFYVVHIQGRSSSICGWESIFLMSRDVASVEEWRERPCVEISKRLQTLSFIESNLGMYSTITSSYCTLMMTMKSLNTIWMLTPLNIVLVSRSSPAIRLFPCFIENVIWRHGYMSDTSWFK